jgi:site-specific DNA-methyltransferase (adenine-specific)
MTVKIFTGDNIEVLRREVQDNSVQVTVTSPPYDNLRKYNGFTWDFEAVARELYRVTKPGGVVVWVVADATVNGSETGTSFRQALYFKECGFNLHDTMIWNKGGFTAVGTLRTRYGSVFEYMFVLSKGPVGTFNPLKDRRNKTVGARNHGTARQPDGTTKKVSCSSIRQEFGQRFNIWDIPNPGVPGQVHPAVYPEALARDHIMSWSNQGDTVLDPFLGSGTTGKMAVQLGRVFIGIDISQEYTDMATKRIMDAEQRLQQTEQNGN